MKLLIAGSRTYANQLIRVVTLLDSIMDNIDAPEMKDVNPGFCMSDITEVISGCASGIDHAAIVWAENHKIPVTKMPADWQKLGAGAGFIRNEEMAKLCDTAIIIWDGKSKGTQDMMTRLDTHGKEFLLWEKLSIIRRPEKSKTYVAL